MENNMSARLSDQTYQSFKMVLRYTRITPLHDRNDSGAQPSGLSIAHKILITAVIHHRTTSVNTTSCQILQLVSPSIFVRPPAYCARQAFPYHPASCLQVSWVRISIVLTSPNYPNTTSFLQRSSGPSHRHRESRREVVDRRG
jgi:hypothetical protein